MEGDRPLLEVPPALAPMVAGRAPTRAGSGGPAATPSSTTWRRPRPTCGGGRAA